MAPGPEHERAVEEEKAKQVAWYHPAGAAFAIAALLTGVGTIGWSEITTLLVNAPPPHVMEHCKIVYEEFSEVVASGHVEGIEIMLSEVRDCNATNSGTLQNEANGESSGTGKE